MYRHAGKPRKGTMPIVNDSIVGESIEDRIERLKNDNEPVMAESPIIHTDPKLGAMPEHDVRTDKWELATDIADIESRNRLLRREVGSQEDKAAQERLKNEADKGETDTTGSGTK